MANLKLPNLSWSSSFFRFAESQWDFSVWLQCNVLDVQDVCYWRAGLYCCCSGWHRLVRILWSRWAFMLQHASTRHPPQLGPLSRLLSQHFKINTNNNAKWSANGAKFCLYSTKLWPADTHMYTNRSYTNNLWNRLRVNVYKQLNI